MHYKDGQEAKLGDLVKGRPYNTPHDVVGHVIGLIPGQDSCNLRVAFLEVEHKERDADGYLRCVVPFTPPRNVSTRGDPGFYHGGGSTGAPQTDPPALLWPCVDYGETKAFDLIARAR